MQSDAALAIDPYAALDAQSDDEAERSKSAELLRLHTSQDWSAIAEDDLQAPDTWVVVRDNKAYHTVNRFHPYFAMCPPPLARRAIEEYSKPGDVVFDPFCGAGVTLVEAMATGRASVGVDVLSMARFITKVKTTLVEISVDDAMAVADRAEELVQSQDLAVDLSRIYNVDYWFTESSQRQLAAMLAAADEDSDPDRRDFYRLGASCVVRLVSNSGNLESHLHIKQGKKIPDGLRLFRLRLLDMVAREREFRRSLPVPASPAVVHAGDSRDLREMLGDASVDLVCTSPPYGTGTKYASVYRLQMQYLGLPKISGALETTKDFLSELGKCISEMHRVLKPGGVVALLYGTNKQISSRDVADVSAACGFTLERTIACPVIDESKMVRGDYRRSMANEHMMVFSKPG